jgi:hypothetical protein
MLGNFLLTQIQYMGNGDTRAFSTMQQSKPRRKLSKNWIANVFLLFAILIF